MQFIEIYIKDELLARVPLGSYDLMKIKSDNWEADALERARLLKMLINQFEQEPLLRQANLKKPSFYLVMESRMNKPKIIEGTTD